MITKFILFLLNPFTRFKEKYFSVEARIERAKSHLVFRQNGDVHYDPSSSDPYFVDFNTKRWLIRVAKIQGKNSLKTALSNQCWDALSRAGYNIRYDHTLPHDQRHVITWGLF